MLLDAQIALPRAAATNARTLDCGAEADVVPPSDSECCVRVLVSRAVGLPQVPVIGSAGAPGPAHSSEGVSITLSPGVNRILSFYRCGCAKGQTT